jgi:MFS family permease
MFIMGSIYSYSVFRLSIEDIFNVTSHQSGYPYMMSLFFYAMLMGLGGRLLRILKPVFVLAIGVFLISLGWFLSYNTSNFLIFTLSYGVLIGSGIGLVYGVPLFVVTQFFEAKRGLYFGVILSGFGLSSLVSAPFFRYYISNNSFHDLMLLMSIVSFFGIGLVSIPYKDMISINVDRSIKKEKIYLNPHFLLFYMIFLLATSIGLSIIGFSASYGVSVLKLSHTSSALSVSIFALFNGFGRILFGYLIDRYSQFKVMYLSLFMIIVSSLLIMLFSSSIIVYVLTFSVFWLNLGGWLAIAPYVTVDLFGKENYSSNYGLLFSAYGISALFGVYISGVIHTFLGYSLVFVFFILLSIIVLLFTRLMQRKTLNNI